ELERIDAQSAFLRAWAEFYLALSSPDSEAHRQARLTELLETITRRYGWTAPQPGHEVQRCSALLMAAVASRLTGQPVEARQYAREVQEAVSQVKDPLARSGLGKIVLLAVLEQIRSPRDAGRLDDAQATLDEARAWARQARPGDLTAELALAFLERSIMVRRLAAGGQPVEPQRLISPPDALPPLQRAASLSPQLRDALYELLSGTSVPDEDPLGAGHSPFAVQLICGSALAAGSAASPAPRSERLGQVAIGLTQALRAPTPPEPQTQGELMFLLARAHYLSDAPLEAARVLCELVEKLPAHDRAGSAAEQAVALAQEALRREGPGREPARAVFVHAGRLLCRHWPTSPAARQLPFFIAAALDEGRQYAEAAEAYAAVPPDDPRALRAAWGQARCLREALNLAPATRPADLPAAQALAGKALAAARSAEQLARSTPDAEPCLAADITLTLAGLLDHSLIARPEEAIQTLEGFERRHAGCPAATAAMLRERVSAYRQLKRMAEARAVMEQVLTADPDNAGPMMARLLEAMREEMESAGERGDAAQRRSIAQEAALLAERLERWADGHPGRLGAVETRTVAVWRAWATLEAGRPDEALELYDRAARLGPQTRPEDRPLDAEIRLGKAECLLEVGKPSEALPLLAAALQQAPEDSPLWWRAFTGTLRAHSALDHDRAQIVQAVRQQRRLHPAMGGPRWKRELEQLERENAPPAEAPAP
ncbi:MAG: tetratricopeptide repeat protein, partial [Phycisphaerae bacterium]